MHSFSTTPPTQPPATHSRSPLHHAPAGVVGGVGGALVLCAAAFLAYKLAYLPHQAAKAASAAQFQQAPAYGSSAYQPPAVAQPAQLAPENPWR